MTPEFRDTFIAVVRHGGVREAIAAQPLHCEQAAVRWQIRALEAELGKKLFQRHPMRPTPFGWDLYRTLVPLVARLGEVEAHLSRRPAGSFHIGVSSFLSPPNGPEAVRRWNETHPDAHLAFKHGETARLRDELRRGDLDLAIVTATFGTLKGLASRVLVETPLVLLVPPGSDLASAARLWDERTIGYRLITPNAAEPITEIFERGIHRGGITWPLRMETDSLESVARLVTGDNGLGLAIEGQRIGHTDRFTHLTAPVGGELKVLTLPGFDLVPVVAVWQHADTRRLQPLLDAIQELFDTATPRQQSAAILADTRPRQRTSSAAHDCRRGGA